MVARKFRCAIYTRKSTDEGLDQDFNSLEAQRESCAAYIMSQTHEGWEALPAHYDDGGYSGGTLERPALQSLMQDIGKGLIDIVVVYKVDRLTRSLADFAKLVELFDRHSVSFVSVTQAFNTTNSMGRLTLNVLLSFAQFEREVTAERIRDKFRASKEKGMWMGGKPPLGYDVDKRKLIINEGEAEQVRHIFDRYLELGSAMALMKDLDARGIHSKRWTTQKGRTIGGACFTRGVLYLLLQNPIYIGKIRHKDQIHEGLHASIIDMKTWGKVQDLLARNRHENRTRKNASAPSLLAGLLFHKDGTPFRPRQSQLQGRRLHYYRHPETTLPAPEIESIVTSELIALLGQQTELCRIIGADHPNLIELVGTTAAQHAAQLKAQPTREVVLNLIEKVTVEQSRIHITLNRQGMAELLGYADTSVVNEDAYSDPVVLTRRYQLKRVGRGKKLIIGAKNPNETAQPDASLLKSIARAHAWLEDLKAGLSYKEIGARDTIDERLVARTVRLAFLAPDITRDILNGREPEGLTSQGLIRLPKLPANWDEQREALGFT
ncbi:DNA invertase Pin-like site-specific DNA recombinase [Parvibaculum indicum]|uniref:recombinase family protein n=1 Tax=Parvibaculum indicum TaxID=562969 RepID=UPI001421A3BF|nr:recombinase family protein [Parvibaculum indicum]NIJ43380.1 DNA invertase Pin-like site-specific DNA recombinase [Parvibaculum indicum]